MSFCRKIPSLCLYVGKKLICYSVFNPSLCHSVEENSRHSVEKQKKCNFFEKNTQKCLEIKKIYLSLYQNLGKVYKPHPENNKKELNINIININNN